MEKKENLMLSVVVPVKDEEENLETLSEEIKTALANIESWECLWVDDGSEDKTLDLIKSICRRDSRFRYVSFERNYGQSAGIIAGFKYARGQIIATIDGDGQNDPADIPKLVSILQTGGYDMVNGKRAKRSDSAVRRISSKIANSVRNAIIGKDVSDVGCSTRVFRRECVQDLPQFRGMHRFLPSLVKMKGYNKITETPVNHRPRLRGTAKYGVGNRLWVGIFDLIGVLWLKKRGFTYKIAEVDNQDSAGT